MKIKITKVRVVNGIHMLPALCFLNTQSQSLLRGVKNE